MEQLQENILAEVDHLVQANGWKRLGNYIVDMLAFYLLAAVVGFVWALASPATVNQVADSSGFGLADRILSLIAYGLYMGLVEGIFKGRSLGKILTGTRAVNEDGSTISFRSGFLRGLCRMVPFEPFSALGSPCYPWHDKWTRTYVIDEKASILPPR